MRSDSGQLCKHWQCTGTQCKHDPLHGEAALNGRSNCCCVLQGRYPVHLHRTRQNSSTVQGCAVYPSSVAQADSLLPRHGIVQHDTQAQLLGNVVVGARGSGIFLEEAGNSGGRHRARCFIWPSVCCGPCVGASRGGCMHGALQARNQWASSTKWLLVDARVRCIALRLPPNPRVSVEDGGTPHDAVVALPMMQWWHSP
jgi:hypothetical protein